MMKERADRILVKKGLAESRQKAQAMIMAGLVFSDDQKVTKSGQLIDPDISLRIKETLPYVGRGGLKLAAALDGFGLDVAGKIAADLGSSTGGFTDCLLQRGARKVFAVDVDDRQLDWGLRQDPRVEAIRKNARYLEPDDFEEQPELVTMDLSFISILKILPAVRRFMSSGKVLALVKPQFEAGRRKVGKGGVIKDSSVHEEVLSSVICGAGKEKFLFKGVMRSPIRGQKGNREFFVFWSLGEAGPSEGDVSHMIRKVVRDEKD